jgi:Protein of unknown function (DUF2853)
MVDISAHIENLEAFAAPVNEAATAAIVKHLGIALQSKDASLVSASDPSELERVRDSWLKRKLGLTHPDTELDAAVKAVVTTLGDAGVREKSRVTVYYLLAQHFDKLDSLA